MNTRSTFALAVSIAAVIASPSFAAVSLPAVFSNGMVIQRDRHVPVWGTADAGEAVAVTFAGQTKETKADAGGKWRVDFAPMSANGFGQPLVVRGANEVKLDDVLIGDVWLCGGQSNMDRPIRLADGADEVAKLSPIPTLRLFRVEKQATTRPAADVKATWQVADGASATEFSGVGFYFGRELHAAVGVPVGLIHSAWGGSSAEAWMSEAALAAPVLQSVLDREAASRQREPADRARYEAALARHRPVMKAWNDKRQAEGDAAAGERPRPPARPVSLSDNKRTSRLYNGMIAPLAPFAVRGVVWYQGEANSRWGAEYRALLPALIADWRQAFEDPRMPFGVVQLANFDPTRVETEHAWTELREAQLKTHQADPNVGLVVTIDVGDPADIHPKDKLTVGKRLARWALARAYGVPALGDWQGPTFASMKPEPQGGARLTFDHARGLAGRGGSTEVEGFEVAGPDRRFVAAKAQVAGATVVVSAPGVPEVVAVRYAWAKNPKATLVNGDDLPASPFRTDDWPLPSPLRDAADAPAAGDGQ